MVNSTKDIIFILNETLKNNESIDLCILYGSGAEDRLTLNSDVDIAIASNIQLTNDFCLNLSVQLTCLMDREVSIINMSKMEGIILEEVLTKGITIKNRDVLLKAHYIIKMYEFNQDILPYHLISMEKNINRFLND